jgi:carbamoylphosphate synthase large subunit
MALSKMSIDSFYFNTKLNDKIYAVESPDAIQSTKESKTILRYYENKFSAATAYLKEYGVVALGFPFETVMASEVRDKIMESVLRFFKLIMKAKIIMSRMKINT